MSQPWRQYDIVPALRILPHLKPCSFLSILISCICRNIQLPDQSLCKDIRALSRLCNPASDLHGSSCLPRVSSSAACWEPSFQSFNCR